MGIPLAAALAMLWASYSILGTARDVPTAEPRIAPPGQPQPLVGAVSASGLLEAEGEQASIGAEVSGMVTTIAVTPGQFVPAGGVLFNQDTRAADADVAVRQSQLSAAEAAFDQAKSLIPGLRAALLTAEASVAEAAAAHADTADLLDSGQKMPMGVSITRREVTKRLNDERVAEARLREATGRVAQARAALEQYQDGTADGQTLVVAAVAVRQARATLQQAQTARDLLTVRAPFDGTVLQVNIRAGEFAQVAGPPAIVFGRLSGLQLRADIDEADIPRFSRDALAVGVPLGDPSRRVAMRLLRVEPLVVPKIALNGGGQERVDTRVLRVVYRIEGSIDGLYPGQQLNLFLTPAPAIPIAEK